MLEPHVGQVGKAICCAVALQGALVVSQSLTLRQAAEMRAGAEDWRCGVMHESGPTVVITSIPTALPPPLAFFAAVSTQAQLVVAIQAVFL